MTALEAIEILKTDMGCYECTFGCSTPYECANGGCPFREAIHLAVERLSIDILPKMIKTEPQTCEDCKHWSDIEDGCADRHGCRATTEDSSTVWTKENCKGCKYNEYPYDSGTCFVRVCINGNKYEPKDEPTTQAETQNSNLTFEKRTMRDCYNCKRYETEGECVECKFEPKDEPQTERHLPDYSYEADLGRRIMEQTEMPRCSVNGTPFDECGFCEYFNCDTCKCEADVPQTELKGSKRLLKGKTEETEMERLERIDNELEDAWARIRELTDEPQTERNSDEDR